MINRCKFLGAGLNICSKTNEGCQYMSDPESCPQPYEEEFDRQYYSPNPKSVGTGLSSKELMERDGSEEVESLTEFTDRIEGELDGMGVKVERGEIEDIIEEDAPDWF